MLFIKLTTVLLLCMISPMQSQKLEEIKSLYASGLSYRKIGKLIGIPAPTVNWNLRKAGVVLRSPAPPLKDKYKEAKNLYESGLSCEECGNYYGLSRENMWAVLKRRGTKFRPQLRTGKNNSLYRGGPTFSQRVISTVRRAIRKGILIPEPCENCGTNGLFKNGVREVQAHHDDYNFPLKVRWLCQKCHNNWHKLNKAIPIKTTTEKI